MSVDDLSSAVESEQIETLIEAAGVDATLAILDAFWQSNQQLLEAALEQVASSDFSEAAKTAHALKGSAANLGAILLSDHARKLEQACKGEDLATAQSTVDELPAHIAVTRQVFEELLKAS